MVVSQQVQDAVEKEDLQLVFNRVAQTARLMLGPLGRDQYIAEIRVLRLVGPPRPAPRPAFVRPFRGAGEPAKGPAAAREGRPTKHASASTSQGNDSTSVGSFFPRNRRLAFRRAASLAMHTPNSLPLVTQWRNS